MPLTQYTWDYKVILSGTHVFSPPQKNKRLRFLFGLKSKVGKRKERAGKNDYVSRIRL